MKRVRFGMGGVLMIAAMAVSDSAGVLLIYFFAAALHELGHICAARLLKIEIKELRFGFSGVRIVTDERLTPYTSELLLAMAGPLVNIAVFGAVVVIFLSKFSGLEALFLSAQGFVATSEGWGGATAFLAVSSLIQALINLLPVNTFDGGRILYCAIAQTVSERAAERIVEVFSAFSALFLWTVALYLMLRIGGGLGIYVFAACIFASMIERGEKR